MRSHINICIRCWLCFRLSAPLFMWPEKEVMKFKPNEIVMICTHIKTEQNEQDNRTFIRGGKNSLKHINWWFCFRGGVSNDHDGDSYSVFYKRWVLLLLLLFKIAQRQKKYKIIICGNNGEDEKMDTKTAPSHLHSTANY